MSKITVELEPGARPSEDEMEVVDILVEHGIPKEHVLFRKPIRIKNMRTSDLLIDGTKWEIKSIGRISKNTLDHAERDGLKQAENLIMDLRKLSEALEGKAIARIEKDFRRTKSWKDLLIIVRSNGTCLTFTK